jgi:murein DD-endopeptidase MepM/ murein hydrolase activator NlpD
LRVSRTFPTAQILALILVVGTLAIGAYYLKPQGGTEETETPTMPLSEPKPDETEHEQEETEEKSEEADEPEEENNGPVMDTVSEPPEEPCSVRIEGVFLSGETFYAGEPVEARVLLRNHGDESCLHELELKVSGLREASIVTDLEADEEREVSFTITRDVHGGFIVQAGNLSAIFYVVHAGLEITNFTITPGTIDPGDLVLFSVDVYNPNHIESTGNVDFKIDEEDYLGRTAIVGPRSTQTITVNTTMFAPGRYYVRVGNNSGFFEVTEEPYGEGESDPDLLRPEPIYYWVPDPSTDNFTNILPPGASPVRLTLPAPIEDIFFEWESGPGAYGLHAGGHIEGLDHVWIEIREGLPVRSWGDGVVTDIRLSGDVEQGEYHIFIDFGQNLTGSHMEVVTPLVEVGDNVSRGDPVGYGMGFFPGEQSAEFGLVDRGRTDGIWVGNGVAVSPYDYLEEEVKLALVEAYKAHTVDKYGRDPRITWLFDAAQPYLTNPLLIHMVNEGRLTGEWYIYSSPWEPGWPNDMLIFIEADNPWYTDNRVLSNDDTDEDSQTRNIDGTFEVDYERGRVLIRNTKYGGILFGIFEIDETGERALLRIEFDEYRYLDEFTDEALIYIERTNLGRRWDAVELGLLEEP